MEEPDGNQGHGPGEQVQTHRPELSAGAQPSGQRDSEVAHR